MAFGHKKEKYSLTRLEACHATTGRSRYLLFSAVGEDVVARGWLGRSKQPHGVVGTRSARFVFSQKGSTGSIEIGWPPCLPPATLLHYLRLISGRSGAHLL